MTAGTEDNEDMVVGREYGLHGRGRIVVVFAGYAGNREGSLSPSFLGLRTVGWEDGEEACGCGNDGSDEDGEGG